MIYLSKLTHTNNDNEEEKEDEELSRRYSHRADLPDDQWITLPPGMDLLEFFNQWLKEKEEEKKK